MMVVILLVCTFIQGLYVNVRYCGVLPRVNGFSLRVTTYLITWKTLKSVYPYWVDICCHQINLQYSSG